MKNKCFFFKKVISAKFGSIIRPLRAVIWGVALIAALLGVLLFVPVDETQADGPDDAHVVVQFGSNDIVVRPISFTAPISGFKALEMTGLEIITQNSGGFIAVCSIEGVGCPASDCFTCDPQGRSWGNTFWNGNDWQGYLTGAADTTINDGAVEGWAYGNFTPPDFAPPSPSYPAPPLTATTSALNWLAGQQSAADGGYGGIGNSIEVLMTIGANNYQGTTWQRQANTPSLSDNIEANGGAYSTLGVAAAGKLAVGLSAGGGCYPTGAVQPGSYYITATGIYSGGFGSGGAGPHSWGMLGTKALSQSIAAEASTYLKSIINTDGGWGWSPGNSDTNGTALAIQALVAAGEPLSSSTIISGLTYLKSAQNGDGGFAFDPNSSLGTDSDTNSTAYVVQAIRATGQDPLTDTWLISNTNPISYLLARQLNDGSFEYQAGGGSNQIATRQAIPALLSRPFPVRMVGQIATCPTSVFLPLILKS